MIITVYNDKGGTTKTTTAINLGMALSMQGKKVLMIDTDKHGGLTRLYMDYAEDHKPSTINLVLDVYGETQTDPNTYIRHCPRLGLDYIPSTPKLNGVNQILNLCPDSGNVLATALAHPYFKQYDYIIIDTQASYDLWVGNAIKAANKIIIPTEAERPAFEILGGTLDKIREIKRRDDIDRYIGGIIITRYQSLSKTCQKYKDLLKKTYPQYLTHNPVPSRAEEKTNADQGIVAVSKRNSDVGKAYREMIDHFHLT